MKKCPKHNREPAIHRAKVMTSPECGLILDAHELLRLLKKLGMSKELIKQVKTEITFNRVFR